MQDNNFKFWAPNKYKNYTQLMVVFLIIVFIALIFMFINVDWSFTSYDSINLWHFMLSSNYICDVYD